MKNCQLLLIPLLSLTLLGCSVLPIKAEIKADHFRFENFKRDKETQLEYIHLMCFHKKPTTWDEPKQYLEGEHNLWVRASIARRDIPYSQREAFVNFKVKLAADKSYMLNRKIVDDNISLWIQEVDTGISVSKVLTTDFSRPLVAQEHLSRRKCLTGSV